MDDVMLQIFDSTPMPREGGWFEVPGILIHAWGSLQNPVFFELNHIREKCMTPITYVVRFEENRVKRSA